MCGLPTDRAWDLHMTRPTAIVGKRELIHSGSIILGAEETIVMMPFDDDPEYRFRFKLSIDESTDTETTIQLDDDQILSLVHRRSRDNIISTGARITQSFAQDETHKFYLSFVIMSFRSSKGEIYLMNYNILRQSR
nr:hypothetical protein NG677_04185 [Methylobacterium sp. OTU13CASTA1]